MRSMTGYGRGQSTKGGTHLNVEVKTVNHRYLDLSIRLPRHLQPLEMQLRKRLGDFFARGRVEFTLSQDQSGAQATLVSPNLPLAHEYAQAAAQLAQAAGVKGNLKLDTLLGLPEVLTLVPLEVDAFSLQDACMEALEAASLAATRDREREGEQLRVFFYEHLLQIEQALIELREVAGEQSALARERLNKRLASQPELQVDPQRLAQEIALFADRSDITEELNRLQAHCQQMRELIDRAEPVGRDMDFLAQEMNREANTICSKSASLAITRLGLVCKSEADKLREQIQNVE